MPEVLARILLDKQRGEIFSHRRSTRVRGAAIRFAVRLGKEKWPGATKLKVVADKLQTPVTSTFVTFRDVDTAQRAWELSSRHIQTSNLPIQVKLSDVKSATVVINVYAKQVARDWSAAIKRPIRGL